MTQWAIDLLLDHPRDGARFCCIIVDIFSKRRTACNVLEKVARALVNSCLQDVHVPAVYEVSMEAKASFISEREHY